MKNYRFLRGLIIIILLGTSFLAISQKSVKGVVIDSLTKEPLVGASILVTGTTAGTVTDIDGKFSLNVPANAVTLTIFFQNYNTKVVQIQASEMTISLSRNANGILTVNGILLDTTLNLWLENVEIKEKGTNNITKSDDRGRFTISVTSKESILIFSNLGYIIKELFVKSININKRDTIVLGHDLSVTPYYVSGIIRDSVTKQVLSNAYVSILSNSRYSRSLFRVKTDQNGQYNIITPKNLNQLIYSSQNYLIKKYNIPPSSDSIIKNDVYLQKAPDSTFITGTVTDSASKKPLENVYVSITYSSIYSNQTLTASIKTNGYGEYSFKILAKPQSIANLTFNLEQYIDRNVTLTLNTYNALKIELQRKFCNSIPVVLRGRVTNNLNEPLVGASVVINGTASGTLTDIDGKYEIKVPDACLLMVYSFVGYNTKIVGIPQVNTQNSIVNLNVQLSEGYLSEIVVIGYGGYANAPKYYGTIQDSITNIPLIKAKLTLPGTNIGTLSEENGQYFKSGRGKILFSKRDYINKIYDFPDVVSDMRDTLINIPLNKHGNFIACAYIVTKTDDPTEAELQANPNAYIGTLRWAIRNAISGCPIPKIIFNIPGNGPQFISLREKIVINRDIEIDGTTQPGYQQNDPKIVINAYNINRASSTYGVFYCRRNTTIKGLKFVNPKITFIYSINNLNLIDNQFEATADYAETILWLDAGNEYVIARNKFNQKSSINSRGKAIDIRFKKSCSIHHNEFHGFSSNISINRMTEPVNLEDVIVLSKNIIEGNNGVNSEGIRANAISAGSLFRIENSSIQAVSTGIVLGKGLSFNFITDNRIILTDKNGGCVFASGQYNFIERNEMSYNSLGITVTSPIEPPYLCNSNRFSKNIFTQLTSQSHKPIDISTSNQPCNIKKAAPKITSITYNSSGNIDVMGTSEPKDSIEIFQSDNTLKNVKKYLLTAVTDQGRNWRATIPIQSLSDGNSIICETLVLAATATDGNANTSELAYKVFEGQQLFPVADFNYTFSCFRDITFTGVGNSLPNWKYILKINGNVVYNSSSVLNFNYSFPSDGVYTVEYIISNKTCSKSITKTINVPQYNLSASLVTKDISCMAKPDGQVTITAAGSFLPITYSLDNQIFAANSIFSNLTVGQHKAYIKDSKGCIKETIFTLLDKSPQIQVTCVPSGACTGSGVQGNFIFKVTRELPQAQGSYHFDIVDETTGQKALQNGLGQFGIVQTVLVNRVIGDHLYKIVVIDERNGLSEWNNCPVEKGQLKSLKPVIGMSRELLERKCFPNQPVDVKLTGGVFIYNSECSKSTPPNFKFEIPELNWTATSSQSVQVNALAKSSYMVKLTYDINGFNCVAQQPIYLPAEYNVETKLVTEDIYCRNSEQQRGGKATVYVTNGANIYYEWFKMATPSVILSTRSTIEKLEPNIDYGVIVYEKPDGSERPECINKNHPTHVFKIKEIPPVPKPEFDKRESDCYLRVFVRHSVDAKPYTFKWTRSYQDTLLTTQNITNTEGEVIRTVVRKVPITKNEAWYYDVVNTWTATGVSSVPIKKPKPGTYVVEVIDGNGCHAKSDPIEFKQADFARTYNLCIRWRTPKMEPELQVVPSKDTTYRAIKTLATNIKNAIDNQTEDCINARKAELIVDTDKFCDNPESIDDKITLQYDIQAYQYTLYYYDRAGNLVRTVAPNGARSDIPDRASRPLQHTFVSTYDYNSLGQMVKQSSPDGGTSNYLYNDLGQLRFSQNARQIAESPQRYSYTKYDNLGRTIESGESRLEVNQGFATLNDVAFLQNQPNYPATNNSEQTFTVFNNPETKVNYFGKPQRFLDNRISYNWTINLNSDTAVTYYSYDPHGNVEWVAQKIPGFTTNYIGYNYDLISNKVTQVKYNEGFADRFFHRYEYDEDNRLTSVKTSRDSVVWERDASYNYYVHGPLKNMIIGHDNLQKVDYTYTIHGWLKGINTPDARESDTEGGGIGKKFGKDLFGMALGYYAGDFTRTNSPFNSLNSPVLPSQTQYKQLYNGNIAHWVSHGSIDNPQDPFNKQTTAEVYTYDYLNRIRSSEYKVGSGFNTASTKYATAYTYDRVGNITSLNRNGGKAGNDEPMDRLTYNYINQKNQLAQVKDAVPNARYEDDIDDQNTNNYKYDALGNLIRDVQEGLTYKWNLQGKLAEVIPDRNANKQKPYLRFAYDPLGNRVKKEVFYNPYIGSTLQLLPDSTKTTYYALSPQGQQMAIYERTTNRVATGGYNAKWSLDAVTLYGSDRLGEYKADAVIYQQPFNSNNFADISYIIKPFSQNTQYQRYFSKLYELKDHLSNVRTVFNDRHYFDSLEQISIYSYYPFGVQNKERSKKVIYYKYGFESLEKDNEIKGEGNSYCFLFRAYDPRLGRFLNVEPLTHEYPSISPYVFVLDNPINAIDPDGRRVYFVGGANNDRDGWNYINRWKNAFANAGINDFVRIDASHGKFGDVLFTNKYRNSGAEYVPIVSNGPMGPDFQGSTAIKVPVNNTMINSTVEQYKQKLKDNPLKEGEQFNMIGYSYGSVLQAQAALKLANEDVVVDNLVLVGSPISNDSELYKELSGNKNIRNIIRIDIPNDKLSNPKSLMEFIKGGWQNKNDSGPHFDLARPGQEADKKIQQSVEQIKKEGIKN